MVWFSTNSIGGRLRLAFGSMFLALAMVGGIALYQTAQLNAASSDLSDNRMPSVLSLSRLEEATMRFRETEGAGCDSGTRCRDRRQCRQIAGDRDCRYRGELERISGDD